MIKIYLLSFIGLVFLNFSHAQNLPCKNLTHTSQTLFYQNTLVDLYKTPDKFYSFDTVKKCGMQYIDFAKIEPPDGKDWVWVAYMGDSICHELFTTTAQRFTGYEPSLQKEIGMLLHGKHLGPTETAEILR